MLSLLQVSRFFAAFIVVLDHIAITMEMPRYYGQPILNGVFGAGRYGVDFFFVLSGFIICYAHWDDVVVQRTDAYSRVKRFSHRRFTRIYPVYWVVLLITLIPLYFVDSRYGKEIQSPLYLIQVITLSKGNGNFLISAWTLTHEVLFYILFSVVIWHRNFGVSLLGTWFVLSALSFTIEFPSGLVAHPEHLGFLFGIGGCYLIKTARIPTPTFIFILGFVGFSACCVLAGYFHAAGELNAMLAQASARGPLLPLFFCSVLMVIGLVEIERSYGIRAKLQLRFLGDASYSLYLVHFPVLDVLIKASYALHVERLVYFETIFAFVLIFTILISLLFYNYVEKPLSRLFNKPFEPQWRSRSRPVRRSALQDQL